MDCKTSSVLIMNYVDETITEEEWADLQSHMMECSQCQEEFQLFTEMLDLIEEVPLYEPSKNFEDMVMNSINHNLYAKAPKRGLQLTPIIFSLGIYITYIVAVTQRGFQKGFGGWEINTAKILQQLSTLGSVLNKVVYPQRILQFLIGAFSWNTKGLFIGYTFGLFTLLLLLTLIKTTLFGLLEDKWRRV